MGGMFDQTTKPQVGLRVTETKTRLIPRGGAAVRGEVFQLDLGRGDAATTNDTFGGTASSFTNVVAVTTAGSKAFPLAIADENIADDNAGWFIRRGMVKGVTVTKASGNVAIGDPLYPVAGHALSADAVAGVAPVAIARQALTAPGASGLPCDIWFDGGDGIRSVAFAAS